MVTGDIWNGAEKGVYELLKSDIKTYWQDKSKEARFVDVHLPDFESKEEIDRYIEIGNRMAENIKKLKDIPCNDDFE